MDSYTIIVVIFGLLILFLLIVLFFVNKILFYKNRIERSLDVCFEHLVERKKIIKDMVSFLESKLEMENTLINELSKINNVIDELKKDNNKLKELKRLDKYYLSFSKLEAVHSFLDKDEDYLELKEISLQNKDRVIYAMDTYDKGVRDYNNYRSSNKWITFISKVFRFKDYDYYS